MAQPQPGELDHGGAQARIAGFRHALLAIHRSALPGGGGQARIGGDLPAIGEAAEKALRPQNSGGFPSDAFQVKQSRRGYRNLTQPESGPLSTPHRICNASVMGRWVSIP